MTFTVQELLANGHGTAHDKEHVSFVSITPDNVEVLRELNGRLFPIKYTERFYNAVVMPELSRFCKLIYVDDVPVGTVSCRFEETEEEVKLYLMTMGVLESYRSKHIGSKTVRHIVDVARASEEPKISRIYLHVWLLNPDAKRFYERNGFKEVGVAVEYYKADIPTRDAWILELELHSQSTNGGNGVDGNAETVTNGVKDADSANGTNGVGVPVNGDAKQ